jgi:hypothetical protein
MIETIGLRNAITGCMVELALHLDKFTSQALVRQHHLTPPGGACLHVIDTATVPQKFELVMDAGKVKRVCTVAWKTDKRLGVSFQP